MTDTLSVFSDASETAARTTPSASAAPRVARFPRLEDLSPSEAKSSRWRQASPWQRRATRLLVPVLIIAAWQFVSEVGLVSDYVLPAPTAIIAAFQELIVTGELQRAIVTSSARAISGLVIGGTIGLVLGLFAGLWKLGDDVFDGPMQMLRMVPSIALIPLFIVWFGINESAKIALIITATAFPIYLNTYAGVRGVDNKLIEAGIIFGLDHRKLARRIILPTALPSILVGLRYAAGSSLLALVAAEQINARSGIGYILTIANQNQRVDIIMAGIIVYALLGLALAAFMSFVERVSLPWRTDIVLG